MRTFNRIVRAVRYGYRPGQLLNRGVFECARLARLPWCLHEPVWLQVYVSSRCNFRCRFCTNHAEGEAGRVEIGYHQPLNDMELSVFKRVADRYDCAMVCSFCGVGEPFLNPQLLDMVAYARSKKMMTEVVTNGSVLTARSRREILESGLDRITVSLLESDPGAHRLLVNSKRPMLGRIAGDIASLVEERNALDVPLEIKVSRVLTRSSLGRAEDFIQMAVSMGVDRVIFNNLIFSEITDYELAECLFEDANTRAYFDKLVEEYGGAVKIEFPVLLRRALADKTPQCEWYWKNLSVDADGNVSGCGRFITPKEEYGKFDAPDAWNNSHFREMRRSFTERRLLECCTNCVESSR